MRAQRAEDLRLPDVILMRAQRAEDLLSFSLVASPGRVGSVFASRRIEDQPQHSANVIAIVAATCEEREQPALPRGRIDVRERTELLSRDLLDRGLFVDAFLDEHVVDRLDAGLARNTAFSEFLLKTSATEPRAHTFRPRELSSERRIIEETDRRQSLDRSVDPVRGLTFSNQQPPKLRRRAPSRRQHVERPIVCLENARLSLELFYKAVTNDNACRKAKSLDRLD